MKSKHRSRRAPAPRQAWSLTPQAARLCTFLAWGIAAAYAIAVVAMIAGPHRIGDVFAETDFYGGYSIGARALLHGRLDVARYGVVGPGYELVLAALGAVIPDLFLAAELLSAVAMIVGLLLWIRILARRADPRLALVAAGFLATNATFFRYGYSVTNDALAFALQSAALAALFLGTRARSAALAGGIAALAFLTRYNAVALLPAGVVAALLGGTLLVDRRRAALLFTAGFVIVVAPWIAFSLSQGQRFSFQFHHNIAYDVFARSKGIAWDDYQRLLQPQFKSLADVIARDPAAVLRRELFNVGDHLRLDARNLMGAPMAWCALAGLLFAAIDDTLRRAWAIGLTGLLFFLTLVPVFYSERYSIPLLPVYAALAAAPFASSRLSLGMPWAKTALAVVPLALAAGTTAARTRHDMTQLPVEALECSRFLRSMARPGDRVICRKPHVAFHAGVEAVTFPFANRLADLAAAARAQKVRWLFFSWPEAEMRPGFWYLLDTTATVPGLIVRHATAPRPAVLYEIGPEFGREPAWLANDTLRTLHLARAKLRVDPTDARALATLGGIAFDRGDYAGARESLRRAAQREPGRYDVWMMLGETSLLLDDAPGAETAYQQALRLRPESPDPRIGLGWASMVARRAQEAAARWRPVISATRDPHTLERMVELFHALGDRQAESEARALLARTGSAR